MKYILFDLDGTLADSSEGIVNCFEYAFRRMGAAPPPRAKLRACIGPPLLDSFRTFCGGDEAEALRGVRFYRERYGEKGWRECVLYPGVAESLARLQAQGHVLGVATSKPQRFAERILRGQGIEGRFPAVVGGREDNSFDDKGDIIREAMRLLGAPRTQTAMVGDRLHDVAGAKKNGILSVGVYGGFAAPGGLEGAGGGFVAEDFSAACRIAACENFSE